MVVDREAGKGNGKKVKSKQEGRKGARVEGGVGAAGIYLGRSSRTEKKRYLCRRAAVALESSTTSQQGTRTGGQMRRSCSRRPTPMWTRDRARAGCLSVRRSGKWKGGKWGSGSKWGRVQQPAAAPGMGWLQHRAHTFCFPRDQPFSAKPGLLEICDRSEVNLSCLCGCHKFVFSFSPHLTLPPHFSPCTTQAANHSEGKVQGIRIPIMKHKVSRVG